MKSNFEKIKNVYKLLKLKFETRWKKGFKGGVKGSSAKWKEVFTNNQNYKYWKETYRVSSRMGFANE